MTVVGYHVLTASPACSSTPSRTSWSATEDVSDRFTYSPGFLERFLVKTSSPMGTRWSRSDLACPRKMPDAAVDHRPRLLDGPRPGERLEDLQLAL